MSDNIQDYEALDAALNGDDRADAPKDLVATAAQVRAMFQAVEAPIRTRKVRRPHRRLALVLAAALGASTLLGGTALASTSAVPGSALYPVKRAVESLTLAIERDPSERANLHLSFASRRLTELQTLLAARRAGESVDVGAAMKAFSDELAAAENELAGLGKDDDAIYAHVQEQIAKHVAVLQALVADKTNPKAAEAIQRAIDNADKAAEHVQQGRRENKPENPGKPDEGAPADAPGKSGNAPGRSD